MGFAEQLVTVGAVLAGGAASYVVGRLTDRDRFRRDLKIRWDERRLDAYADYASAAKQACRLANRILRSRFRPGETDDVTGLIAELNSAERERSISFEQVVLLGDPAAVAAAHELNERLWSLTRPADGLEHIDENSWLARTEEWIAALNEFHSCVRQGLDIAGTLDPQNTIPREVMQREIALGGGGGD